MIVPMTASHHDDVVRESFRRQVGLFSGPDSPFARREGSTGWIEPLAPSMVLLEVACGAAHVAETLAPAVRQIVGIDLTPELLDLGAGRIRDTGIDNVLLQEGNAEALPFVDRSFDVVYCRSSLHHFMHPDRAVSEMARVCRPGGRVVLMDLVVPDAPVRDVFDHLHRLLDPSHVRVLTEHELAQVFPAGVALTHGETTTSRLPLDIAVTEQSDRDGVVAALRNEIEGGEPTGFDPADESGTMTVAFTTCVVHGTIA
jgi:SAM-dependent methyltransferase